MKLLIITQVLDKEHAILGFFHRWVEEFAQHCDHVQVICLQAGKCELPSNVTVHSLGKESGKGRLSYLISFYRLIWQLRHEYDSVFVHMNQIYVVLGAPLWRFLGKKIGLWYMHGSVSPSLKAAEKLAHHIFTGSVESFRLKSAKLIVTGHGIDTTRFAPRPSSKDIDLITVGRITPSKNLQGLIDAFGMVRKSSNVTLTIVGTAVTDDERRYEVALKEQVVANGLAESVIFRGKVAQKDLPTVLNRAKLFVTTAQNGSLDKAVLEAMACGLSVVSMAPGSVSLPLGTAQVTTPDQFVTEVKKVLESGLYINESHADYVTQHHSLHALIPKILQSLS